MLFVLLVVLCVSVSLAAAEGADGLASSEAFLRELTDGPAPAPYTNITPPPVPHVTPSGTNDESFYKELEEFLKPEVGEYLATVRDARRYGAGPPSHPASPAPSAPRIPQEPVTQRLPTEPTAYHSIQRRVPQHLRQPQRQHRPLRLSDVYFKERKLPRSRQPRKYAIGPSLTDANIDPWRVIRNRHLQPHKARKRVNPPLTPVVPKPSLKLYQQPSVEPELKQFQIEITTEAQQFRRPMDHMFGPLLEESPSPSLPADLAGLRQAAEAAQPVPRPRLIYTPATIVWSAADQLPVSQTTSPPPPPAPPSSPPLPPPTPVTAAVPVPLTVSWSPSTPLKHESTSNKQPKFEKILSFIKKNRKLLMQFIANKRLEMAQSGVVKVQTQDAVKAISGAMLLMKDSLRRAQMGKERNILVTSDAPPEQRADRTWDYDVLQPSIAPHPNIAAHQMLAATPAYLAAASPPLATTTKHIMSAKEIAQEKEARLLLARLMSSGGGGGGGAGAVMRARDEDAGGNRQIYIPPHMLDMAPAKGRIVQQLRQKHRLCQRHILNPEGPKYRRNGEPYIQAFRAVQGHDFAVTRPPQLLIPICCNCCIKSVLGCE